MAEVNPPSWLRDGCHTAEGDRQLINALVCVEGVSSLLSGSLVVTDGASGLQVNVAAGRAFIQGDSASDQGMYAVYNDATEVLTAGTANPTNPRIDLVVARVYDSQYTGALDEWALEIVAGTAAASPVPPSLPINAIPLAEVTVLAGATTLSSSDIVDVRTSFELCIDEVFFSAYRSTAFTVAPGITSTFNWNTTIEATNCTLTGNTRLTLPPGLYRLDVSIKYDGCNGESSFFDVRLNSAGSASGGTRLCSWRLLNGADNTPDRSLTGSKAFRLSDGDYIETFLGTSGSMGGTLAVVTGEGETFISVTRVGV